METIVIQPKNKADVKFWLELAKKTGTKAKAVSLEEAEDLALALLIEHGLETEDVDRESVMQALGR
jgi:hypothetical protein